MVFLEPLEKILLWKRHNLLPGEGCLTLIMIEMIIMNMLVMMMIMMKERNGLVSRLSQ